MPKQKQQDSNQGLTPRPPIVTIMGHVDHGKTTLLDAIRQSQIVKTESGGITQHIGAYQIEHEGKKITFIDTPGHAAFSQMRSRGAALTDLVILVVAANDGVKPQTVESIKRIKAAKVPIIVAINKIDVVGASPEMVKAQLTEYEIFTEGYGGQTPAVNISALKKQGIDDLLEMIILVADMEELKADENAPVEATIIETVQDPHRGPKISVIVNQGTLRINQRVFIGETEVKIRSLISDRGETIELAGPSTPVEIIGCKTLPEVGEQVTAQSVIKTLVAPSKQPSQLTPLAEESTTLNVILRADTLGTLEAIRTNVASEISILDAAVGGISESDILLAHTTKAKLIGFKVPISSSAKRLAQIEKVKYETFEVIYELLEYLEQKVLKLLEPTIDEEILGEAKVLATFSIKGDFILGCRVISGQIEKSHPLHLYRDELLVRDAHIRTIRHGKEEISVAKNGTDCGLALTKTIDAREGDVIKSYRKIETD